MCPLGEPFSIIDTGPLLFTQLTPIVV